MTCAATAARIRAKTQAATKPPRLARRSLPALVAGVALLCAGPAWAEGWNWRAEAASESAREAAPEAASDRARDTAPDIAPDTAPKAARDATGQAAAPEGGAVSGAIADIMAPNRPDAQARERDLEALRRRATSGVPR